MRALIYCRVSSQRQVDEGHGLESQEQRCRRLAKDLDAKVAEVFRDEGVSGGLFDRPAMKMLISYLDKYPTENFYIIFDDMSRFARDLKTHLLLRGELKSRGAILKCLNFNFEDNIESELSENISASVAQYDRQKNRRQVMQKMKARIELGYWPFCYPPGLINNNNAVHGKILIPHEPYATIYKKAIEDYRDGLLNTLEQVQQSINLQYKERGLNRTISLNGSQRILTNILYAGWIEYKPWNVPLQKGKHTGFISKETYDTVQEKLFNKSRTTLRKDYNEDFPMRGFVLCDYCKKPMTASWSKGRSSKYPHYFCKNAVCQYRWKTVLKHVIEPKFKGLLQELTPHPETVKLTEAIFIDIWNNRGKLEYRQTKNTDLEIQKLKENKKFFKERLPSLKSEAMVKEYETEVEEINIKINGLENSQPIKIYTHQNFGTAFDTVINRIKEPVQMWESPNYKDKRLLLEMYFEEKIPYNLSSGFGTVGLACLPKLLCIKPEEKNQLVEMPGIGPGSGETLL